MVSSTPRPYLNPGKDPVPIVQEAGWAPEPVWTGGKYRPIGIRSPDRPARLSVTIPTELTGPQTGSNKRDKFTYKAFGKENEWAQQLDRKS